MNKKTELINKIEKLEQEVTAFNIVKKKIKGLENFKLCLNNLKGNNQVLIEKWLSYFSLKSFPIVATSSSTSCRPRSLIPPIS